MGPVVFAFYLGALIKYPKSDDAAGDGYLIDCSYEILTFRIERAGFALAIEPVKKMVDYLIDHHEKFLVNTAVYGDRLEKHTALKQRLAGLA